MEWLLGVQRGNGVIARYMEGVQRAHGGCVEGYGMVARCTEGECSPHALHVPSCTLCMPCLHLVTTLFPLCTPSNHSIPLPHPLHVLCAPFVYPSCALYAPSNHSIAPSMHPATIQYPPLHTLHAPINHSILPSVHLATFHTPLHTLHTSSVHLTTTPFHLCAPLHTPSVCCLCTLHTPSNHSIPSLHI